MAPEIVAAGKITATRADLEGAGTGTMFAVLFRMEQMWRTMVDEDGHYSFAVT